MNSDQPHGQRRAGLLLHPTSLPGAHDHGDLGHQAYRFIEFLHASGIKVWQTLPLGPTHEDLSPYQCLSVHAGNPLLISMDWLIDRQWLLQETLNEAPLNDSHRKKCLIEAFSKFRQTRDHYYQRYLAFIEKESYWLNDYALFVAIRNHQPRQAWMDWPEPLRNREPETLQKIHSILAKDVERIKFEQFVFFQQWLELKNYAHQHQIQMFGDMPIFVAHDSAEVWAHPEFFSIDHQGHATRVAGVPPDYFSATGQRWGNPLYEWQRMEADNFTWWVNRMQTQLELFDLVRIDHFRGFEAYWEIPATEKTAMNGHWVKAPGQQLLATLHDHFDPLPIIAEDLGIITAEVDALREEFDIPGMKVLQFAFSGEPENPYLPHQHVHNGVVYTGTHDNDTTLSWFESLDKNTQRYVMEYLGNSSDPMPWPLIRAAISSVADLCILPMQDILALGAGHRMNTPGTQENNWQWRFDWNQVPDGLTEKLKSMLARYQR